jgi:hypothetical protein
MRKLGVPQEEVATALRQPVPEENAIAIAPHLVEVVHVFSSLRSQWRTVSNGMAGVVFTGLDYTALEPTLRMLGLEPVNRPRLFEHLRTMEMEALRVMNATR